MLGVNVIEDSQSLPNLSAMTVERSAVSRDSSPGTALTVSAREVIKYFYVKVATIRRCGSTIISAPREGR